LWERRGKGERGTGVSGSMDTCIVEDEAIDRRVLVAAPFLE